MPTNFDLERARRGDLDSFRRIVEKHSPDVYGLAFKLTRNTDDADDVVQETFIKAWKSLPSFEGRAALGTWLYRIATNCAYDLLRKRNRLAAREESLDGGSGRQVEDLAERHSLTGEGKLHLNRDFPRELGRALEALTDPERTVFVLRHLEERPLVEIGELLGMKTNAVKQTVFRAVRKVRLHLQPLMEAT